MTTGTARRRARRPIVVLAAVFIGLSTLGVAAGAALGATGAASAGAQPGPDHHHGARPGPDVER